MYQSILNRKRRCGFGSFGFGFMFIQLGQWTQEGKIGKKEKEIACFEELDVFFGRPLKFLCQWNKFSNIFYLFLLSKTWAWIRIHHFTKTAGSGSWSKFNKSGSLRLAQHRQSRWLATCVTHRAQELRWKSQIWFWRKSTTFVSWPVTNVDRVFRAPNGTRLSARCNFTGPKKLSNSRAQPPHTSPRNGYARIQNIIHGAV